MTPASASRLGAGSRFAVRVPVGIVRKDDRPRDPWTHESATVNAKRSLNVIVIDDHPEVLRGMAAILSKWGHRPITASTATDAVVQLITADLQPDLVISDYHLAAGAKGDQAISEVQREFDAKSPALIMTSDPDVGLRERLQARGMTVLAKPVNLGKLRAMLDRLPGSRDP